MGGDRITRRLWQEDWRDKAVRKAQEGGKLLVGNIAPGSGKTLGTLDVANEFFRHRMIDCVAVFVPRINLCTQYELDWAAISSKFCPPVMGRVDFRKNNPPLIRDNFGYVTTYASLIAAVEFHIQQLKGKRFMMIIDEAQMLGCDTDEPGLGTQSGIAIERLAALPNCVFVQLVSGTPYRADGQRLVLAQYDGPDADGKSYLKADVTVSYLEGVSMGYLRPFEAILHDGAALREYLDGEKEHLYLSKMDKGVSAILMDERFWAPMVDATIQKVLECQMVHLDFCGLIGACNQDHAKRIQKYISNHSAGVKSLIAVSSEDAAQDNLRDFKKGGYDILITVAMAHVGYDHKPITVVCCLNAFREKGWLDQFAARGLRVFSDVLLHLQMLYFICPDDKKMRSWVESMRVQSDQGIRERAARKENDDAKEKESEPGISSRRSRRGRTVRRTTLRR